MRPCDVSCLIIKGAFGMLLMPLMDAAILYMSIKPNIFFNLLTDIETVMS